MSHKRPAEDCHQVLPAHDAVRDALEPLKRLRLAEGTPATPTFSPARRHPEKGNPAVTPQQPLPTIPEHREHQPRVHLEPCSEQDLAAGQAVREVYPDRIELAPSQEHGHDSRWGAAGGDAELLDRGGSESDDECEAAPAAHRRRRGQTQYRLVLPDRLPAVPPEIAHAPGGAAAMGLSGPFPLPPYHLYALVPYVTPQEALGLAPPPAGDAMGGDDEMALDGSVAEQEQEDDVDAMME